MTGKTHMIIGAVVASGYAICLKDINLGTQVVAGSVIGSLMVDIDSKRSKASQAFTRVITLATWALVLGNTLGDSLGGITEYISNHSSGYLIAFALLVTLGKMSPHRGFTHKWLGAILFCAMSLFVFKEYVAIGFVIGYIMHLLADKCTPDGLSIHEFRLPLQDSKGKLKYHF